MRECRANSPDLDDRYEITLDAVHSIRAHVDQSKNKICIWISLFYQ